MAARIGRFAVAVCVLGCAGCAGGVGSLAPPSALTPPAVTPSVEVSAEPVPEPPYREPSDELRSLATRFVINALAYDALTEGQRAFLGRLDALATPNEIRQLRSSGRAHLRWWVLRQRGERTIVHVTGVSLGPDQTDRMRIDVEAIRTTHARESTVRDFVDVALVVVPAPEGWRVDRAEGGGL